MVKKEGKTTMNTDFCGKLGELEVEASHAGWTRHTSLVDNASDGDRDTMAGCKLGA